MLTYEIQFPKSWDGSNLHLLLYFDDSTQWSAVYKNSSKNCYQKEAVLNPENNQIVYLGERTGWTGCVNVDENTTRCKASRSFASTRERWWFIAASQCGTTVGLSMNYTLRLTNGDDFFKKEFSADEFYILEVDIAFCLCIFVLFCISCGVASHLREKQLFHSTYKLYMFALGFQFVALIVLCAAYGKYARDGRDDYGVKTFGRVLESISILIFLLLLILMGKGFTVTRGRISSSGSVKLAVFMTIFTLTYAVLFIYQAEWFDPGLVLYLYDSTPGYALLILRLIGWLWFCYGVFFTVKHFPKKTPFYCMLFISYTIWFWANPVAVLIANFAMPPWLREKVANGVFNAVALSCLTLFLYITWPSRANSNFPYHIRTTQDTSLSKTVQHAMGIGHQAKKAEDMCEIPSYTTTFRERRQIDVMRSPGELTNSPTTSRDSWELNGQADTSDGMKFTDLFTVSNGLNGIQRSKERAISHQSQLRAASKQIVPNLNNAQLAARQLSPIDGSLSQSQQLSADGLRQQNEALSRAPDKLSVPRETTTYSGHFAVTNNNTPVTTVEG